MYIPPQETWSLASIELVAYSQVKHKRKMSPIKSKNRGLQELLKCPGARRHSAWPIIAHVYYCSSVQYHVILLRVTINRSRTSSHGKGRFTIRTETATDVPGTTYHSSTLQHTLSINSRAKGSRKNKTSFVCIRSLLVGINHVTYYTDGTDYLRVRLWPWHTF